MPSAKREDGNGIDHADDTDADAMSRLMTGSAGERGGCFMMSGRLLQPQGERGRRR